MRRARFGFGSVPGGCFESEYRSWKRDAETEKEKGERKGEKRKGKGATRGAEEERRGGENEKESTYAQSLLTALLCYAHKRVFICISVWVLFVFMFVVLALVLGSTDMTWHDAQFAFECRCDGEGRR